MGAGVGVQPQAFPGLDLWKVSPKAEELARNRKPHSRRPALALDSSTGVSPGLLFPQPQVPSAHQGGQFNGSVATGHERLWGHRLGGSSKGRALCRQVGGQGEVRSALNLTPTPPNNTPASGREGKFSPGRALGPSRLRSNCLLCGPEAATSSLGTHTVRWEMGWGAPKQEVGDTDPSNRKWGTQSPQE